MRTLTDKLAARPDTLLVLLPGAQTVLEDFERNGFVQAVRNRGIAADILMADINSEHVMAGTVVSTLHENVVQPARAAGYRHIWLAGISLGGLNALLYATEHAEQLSGIHLLAPYPGTNDIVTEIRAAGGPQAWAQTPEAALGDERVIWHWLLDQAAKDSPIPVSFGCGSEDRFIRNQRLLAELLPADRVEYFPGGHDWPTWQALWASWLDDAVLPRQQAVSRMGS
jgi:pimeloyl-ACP methyl ester carboxylesterase